MLDRLAPLTHLLRMLIKPALYGLENMLMFPSCDQSLLALVQLFLIAQLTRRQHSRTGVSIDRQARILFARNDLQGSLSPAFPCAATMPKRLGQMRPQRIDQLGPLPHQKIARSMQHQTALLLCRSDLYKTHGPGGL